VASLKSFPGLARILHAFMKNMIKNFNPLFPASYTDEQRHISMRTVSSNIYLLFSSFDTIVSSHKQHHKSSPHKRCEGRTKLTIKFPETPFAINARKQAIVVVLKWRYANALRGVHGFIMKF